MPIENIFDESKRILDEARRRNILLRLLGGIAIYTRCPSARKPQLARRYVDIDMIGRSKQSAELKDFFSELGYLPRQKFNSMYGDRRLIFNDMAHNRRVDVFLDYFEMCHRLDMKERLTSDQLTIPLADLLLTKLQVVEITEKDLKDCVCILLDHEIGRADGDMVNGAYIAKICSDDWGIYRTVTANFDKLASFVSSLNLGEESNIVYSRISALRKMIEDQPKSLRWRLRAKIGDKVPWYTLPEPDKEIIDSSIPTGTTAQQG